MNLISVKIFHHKDEDKDHPKPEKVKITYPYSQGASYTNEETITPHEGHLAVNYGLYGRSGFFNNILQIIGEMGGTRIEKKLPLSSCNITDYFNL